MTVAVSLRCRAIAIAAACFASPLVAQRAPAPPADLIVTNAKIYTVDESRPFVSALAVREGRVQFAGSEREALQLKGPSTRMIDAGGQTVIPGMIDAHAHLFGLGTFLRDIDLTDTRSYETIVSRVGARVPRAAAGGWILGRGWDQNKWGDTRFPTHDALTRVSPNNPVVLTRIDGHAILANAAAMKAAGVTAATKDPAGGKIERTSTGEPTGVFIDNAMDLVNRHIPPLTRDDRRAATLAAIAAANEVGLVGVHDAGEPRDVIDTFEELAKAGTFNLRVYVMVGDDSTAIAHYFQRGPQSALYDGRLWIRSIKLYADGALGSRGAALLDPYADDAKNVGLLRTTADHMRDVATRALRNGFQVGIHAIGDRGNRI
ncbi:MAG TPA: amidohydrolase family protein, partial [Gemmatimonadaceae bacterium]